MTDSRFAARHAQHVRKVHGQLVVVCFGNGSTVEHITAQICCTAIIIASIVTVVVIVVTIKVAVGLNAFLGFGNFKRRLHALDGSGKTRSHLDGLASAGTKRSR